MLYKAIMTIDNFYCGILFYSVKKEVLESTNDFTSSYLNYKGIRKIK